VHDALPIYGPDGPQLVRTGALLPDLQDSARSGADAHGIHTAAAGPLADDAHGAVVDRHQGPHLAAAQHIVPQLQPGAVGGARHGQVDHLAIGPAVDAVAVLAHAVEKPLLFGLVLVLAQPQLRAAGAVVAHIADDVAAGRSDGVGAAGFDQGLFDCSHVLSLHIHSLSKRAPM